MRSELEPSLPMAGGQACGKPGGASHLQPPLPTATSAPPQHLEAGRRPGEQGEDQQQRPGCCGTSPFSLPSPRASSPRLPSTRHGQQGMLFRTLQMLLRLLVLVAASMQLLFKSQALLVVAAQPGPSSSPSFAASAAALVASAAASLDPNEPVLNAETESCMMSKLTSMIASCQAQAGAGLDAEAGLRAGFQSMLESCLFPTELTGNISVLLPEMGSAALKIVTHAISTLSSAPLNIDTYPVQEILGSNFTLRTNNATGETYAAWTVFSDAIGSAVASNAVVDLTASMQQDLSDWPISLRNYGMIYNGLVFGMPVTGGPNVIFYRTSTFERHKWQLPETLDALLDFARANNGTDGKWAFCMPWCMGNAVLGPSVNAGNFYMFLGSLMQANGPSSGLYFDPVTLKQMMANNAATDYVLETLQELNLHSLGSTNCKPFDLDFAFDKCHIMLNSANEFKLMAHNSSVVGSMLRGDLGCGLMPGSRRVLNRATGLLEDCTPVNCPLAQPSADGTYLINRAIRFRVLLAMLNNDKPLSVQKRAFQLMQKLTSAETQFKLMTDPTTMQGSPMRLSHFDPQPWISGGWNANDTTKFLRVLKDSFNSRNVAFGLRIPGAQDINAIVGHMLMGAIEAAGKPNATDYLRPLQLDAEAKINAVVEQNGGLNMIRNVYTASINYKLDSPPMPPGPSSKPPEAVAPAPSGFDSSLDVVLPCVVAAVVTLMGTALFVWWYRRRKLARRSAEGGWILKAPGPGPETCLCITDIQNSTALWETMPANAISQALKLHNKVLRALMREHRGYESATEGDSFIIAFPTPAQALAFALEAQRELMNVDWPAEILAGPDGCEMWAVPKLSKPSLEDGPIAGGDEQGERSPIGAALSATPEEGAAEGRAALTRLLSRGRSMKRLSAEDGEGIATPSAHTFSVAPSEDLEPVIDEWTVSPAIKLSDIQGVNEDSLPTLWGSMGHAWRLALSTEQPAPSTIPGSQLLIRGLRVRIGLHCGVPEGAVRVNAVSGRSVYSGMCMHTAKTVSDCVCGGLVVLSEAARLQLVQGASGKALPHNAALLHVGGFVVQEDQVQSRVDPTQVYLAYTRALALRLPLFDRPRPKNGAFCNLGVLDLLHYVPQPISQDSGTASPSHVPSPRHQARSQSIASSLFGGSNQNIRRSNHAANSASMPGNRHGSLPMPPVVTSSSGAGHGSSSGLRPSRSTHSLQCSPAPHRGSFGGPQLSSSTNSRNSLATLRAAAAAAGSSGASLSPSRLSLTHDAPLSSLYSPTPVDMAASAILPFVGESYPQLSLDPEELQLGHTSPLPAVPAAVTVNEDLVTAPAPNADAAVTAAAPAPAAIVDDPPAIAAGPAATTPAAAVAPADAAAVTKEASPSGSARDTGPPPMVYRAPLSMKRREITPAGEAEGPNEGARWGERSDRIPRQKSEHQWRRGSVDNAAALYATSAAAEQKWEEIQPALSFDASLEGKIPISSSRARRSSALTFALLSQANTSTGSALREFAGMEFGGFDAKPQEPSCQAVSSGRQSAGGTSFPQRATPVSVLGAQQSKLSVETGNTSLVSPGGHSPMDESSFPFPCASLSPSPSPQLDVLSKAEGSLPKPVNTSMGSVGLSLLSSSNALEELPLPPSLPQLSGNGKRGGSVSGVLRIPALTAEGTHGRRSQDTYGSTLSRTTSIASEGARRPLPTLTILRNNVAVDFVSLQEDEATPDQQWTGVPKEWDPNGQTKPASSSPFPGNLAQGLATIALQQQYAAAAGFGTGAYPMASGYYGGSAFGAQHLQVSTPSWALAPMPPSPLNLEVLGSSTTKPHISATVSISVLRIQVVGLSLMREFDEELCSEALSLIHATVDQMVGMAGWWVGLPPDGPQRLFCHALENAQGSIVVVFGEVPQYAKPVVEGSQVPAAQHFARRLSRTLTEEVQWPERLLQCAVCNEVEAHTLQQLKAAGSQSAAKQYSSPSRKPIFTKEGASRMFSIPSVKLGFSISRENSVHNGSAHGQSAHAGSARQGLSSHGTSSHAKASYGRAHSSVTDVYTSSPSIFRGRTVSLNNQPAGKLKGQAPGGLLGRKSKSLKTLLEVASNSGSPPTGGPGASSMTGESGAVYKEEESLYATAPIFGAMALGGGSIMASQPDMRRSRLNSSEFLGTGGDTGISNLMDSTFSDAMLSNQPTAQAIPRGARAGRKSWADAEDELNSLWETSEAPQSPRHQSSYLQIHRLQSACIQGVNPSEPLPTPRQGSGMLSMSVGTKHGFGSRSRQEEGRYGRQSSAGASGLGSPGKQSGRDVLSSLKTWAKGLRPQQLPDLIFEDTAEQAPRGGMLAPWGEQDMESGRLSHEMSQDFCPMAFQSASQGVGGRFEGMGSNTDSLLSLPLPSTSSGGVPSGLRGTAMLAAANRSGASMGPARVTAPRSPLSGSGHPTQFKQHPGDGQSSCSERESPFLAAAVHGQLGLPAASSNSSANVLTMQNQGAANATGGVKEPPTLLQECNAAKSSPISFVPTTPSQRASSEADNGLSPVVPKGQQRSTAVTATDPSPAFIFTSNLDDQPEEDDGAPEPDLPNNSSWRRADLVHMFDPAAPESRPSAHDRSQLMETRSETQVTDASSVSASLRNVPPAAGSRAAGLGNGRHIMFRGPRIKAAIISGACQVTVNPCTGLLSLNKKTEARLRSMATRVHPGTAWVHFLEPPQANAAGVQCKPKEGAEKLKDYMVAL